MLVSRSVIVTPNTEHSQQFRVLTPKKPKTQDPPPPGLRFRAEWWFVRVSEKSEKRSMGTYQELGIKWTIKQNMKCAMTSAVGGDIQGLRV